MEALSSLLSWQSIAATVVLYYATLALYRLYLHPLARFPGPKLAAVTRLYEGYYDLYQSGQYTFKIAELHKQYGPIIRISPYELHVNDPAFFDTLYNRQEGVWHKYDWSVDAFATKGATLWTADHTLHKNRRLPLSPFFSKVKVSNRQDMIMRHVQALFHRLSGFAASQKTVDLGAAFTAFVRDVSNEYILGKHYNDLGKEDFDAGMVVAAQAGGLLWRTTKFIRFFGPLMRSIPTQWIMAVSDPIMKDFFRFHMMSMNDTKNLMKAAVSPDDDGPRTLVHEIMQSKLPPPEKSFERVFDDMSTTTGAGFETTAAVIRIATFHIYNNSKILQKLRAELTAAPDRELKTLEQLPYLTAIIMEAMRLAPAIATRSARIAQDKDLVYADWRIPAGTPVGMTLHLLHQNEEEYPEPQRFNPDRFMDPNPWQLGNKTFVPFGKGKRSCIGMYLAWAEIYLLLGYIVHRFEFKFPTTKAEDFYVTQDNFALVTPSMGVVPALVTEVTV
ncbi:cytochrome P450 [Annulohypoxylon truncatum]|uniref:cytochrome P450 n=1 Tax=Annulohypoxylon truncatum TaxID=327061 RepID=UPI002007FE4F|nr:cytochrome P450 [Annulohypoxylon truncatum]KAI1205170.1 cytochrome P450 [Annulohypoxylon truncatum]